ncbi:MAG: M23 family metallopeptidase [Candidatus Marinimicrobia bacterium]|nr:M23 family metallopeptidase [Candidatus Neomarinimicrobiota bacterium]
MDNQKKYVIILIALILLCGGTWFFLVYYEGEKPAITVSENIDPIGKERTVNITCTDQKSGLKNIAVTITQGENQHILNTVDFSQKGVKKHVLTVIIEPENLKLHDGTATFEVLAGDYSLRKNINSITVNVNIDTTPPQIYPVSTSHNINPGGSCITIYRIPGEVSKSYVYVDDVHFPAYPITLSDKQSYICYFTIPMDAKNNGVKIGIVAEDMAENSSINAIPFHIRNKKFRKDNMLISQEFLNKKIPEFRRMNNSLRKNSLLESFIYINEKVRTDNMKTIKKICSKTKGKQLWHGAFLRMKNAATMGKFGDMRTYYFKGKEISKSIHMGIDLASTKNALIEASNSGIIVFTGYLGIYGNTIIIDHGLGLFSFYAHLGMINVKKGEEVAKGQPIGRSDTSGLAGGDHLHFGIFVGNKFVNPREWWDPHWIKDNVGRKLDEAAQR